MYRITGGASALRRVFQIHPSSPGRGNRSVPDPTTTRDKTSQGHNQPAGGAGRKLVTALSPGANAVAEAAPGFQRGWRRARRSVQLRRGAYSLGISGTRFALPFVPAGLWPGPLSPRCTWRPPLGRKRAPRERDPSNLGCIFCTFRMGRREENRSVLGLAVPPHIGPNGRGHDRVPVPIPVHPLCSGHALFGRFARTGGVLGMRVKQGVWVPACGAL